MRLRSCRRTSNPYSSRNEIVGNYEKVNRGDPIYMVQEERSPALRRWAPVSGHVLGNRSLADINAQLEEFSMKIWDDNTLDTWIKDPQRFIPGNTMTFPGIGDVGHRADLLAFLKEATQPGHARSEAGSQRGGMMGMTSGGMMGMGGGGSVPNLKNVAAEERVQKVAHCGDSYKVTTADGKSRVFWERNLRFKTDTSEDGPQKGAPAVVAAGMMGDPGRHHFRCTRRNQRVNIAGVLRRPRSARTR